LDFNNSDFWKLFVVFWKHTLGVFLLDELNYLKVLAFNIEDGCFIFFIVELFILENNNSFSNLSEFDVNLLFHGFHFCINVPFCK
jgi:hypothetical protein